MIRGQAQTKVSKRVRNAHTVANTRPHADINNTSGRKARLAPRCESLIRPRYAFTRALPGHTASGHTIDSAGNMGEDVRNVLVFVPDRAARRPMSNTAS